MKKSNKQILQEFKQSQNKTKFIIFLNGFSYQQLQKVSQKLNIPTTYNTKNSLIKAIAKSPFGYNQVWEVIKGN